MSSTPHMPHAQRNSVDAKRRRTQSFSNEQYAAGAICRVTLHNFMSYSDAELFDPGPRLNCIVGPNGAARQC
ncbi:hypothetical protein T492DRAFT_874795 [Pavlovales sp. CCMP2436]|nr:hypothetical protein T492DRAFT_874795 [Pavlovales sp. CCMP2436]